MSTFALFAVIGWKNTEARRKSPLLILLDLDRRTKIIKGLAFFDIVYKEIIPLPFLAPFLQGQHYYLGSSHGLIFVGELISQSLAIKLVNPLAHVVIDIRSFGA